MPFTFMWPLILVVPNLLLATGGLLLWRRDRSAATLLIGVGFTAVLAGLVTSLFESFEYSASSRGHPDAPLVVLHIHAITQAIHKIALLGLWAAGVGLLWHAARRR